jgi:hypothetical protein
MMPGGPEMWATMVGFTFTCAVWLIWQRIREGYLSRHPHR